MLFIWKGEAVFCTLAKLHHCLGSFVEHSIVKLNYSEPSALLSCGGLYRVQITFSLFILTHPSGMPTVDTTQSRSAVHLEFYKLTAEAQEAAAHF